MKDKRIGNLVYLRITTKNARLQKENNIVFFRIMQTNMDFRSADIIALLHSDTSKVLGELKDFNVEDVIGLVPYSIVDANLDLTKDIPLSLIKSDSMWTKYYTEDNKQIADEIYKYIGFNPVE